MKDPITIRDCYIENQLKIRDHSTINHCYSAKSEVDNSLNKKFGRFESKRNFNSHTKDQ